MATKTLATTYNPREVEPARYQAWIQRGYFRALPDPNKRPWAVMMPLPNVTGELHIGHALNNTLQDVLTRFRRMQGYAALYQPGIDHAGIATQNVVERELAREGINLHDLGRERFEERVWSWVEKYGNIIYSQLKRLGVSCDWERKVFTLDRHYHEAVVEAFVRLYNKGLIYRGKYMVNWCPRDQSVISDLEVEYEDVDSQLWHVRYRGADGSPGVVIATQRPETILADVAVAVHPEDERYRNLIGTQVVVPIVNRPVPVISDARVDPEFGTGALKITPGHDPLDNEIGRDHHLPVLVVLDPQARMTADTGPYAGMDRFEAREAVARDLRSAGLVERTEPYRTSVGTCDRCHTVIEPYISDQWFCEMKELPARAAAAIRSGRVRFYHERWAKVALDWLDHIRPWPISRQLWWGHRIPVWQCDSCGERMASKKPPERCAKCGREALTQDPDVLDTWFSSAIWPMATLGWPKETVDLRYWYPGSILITDRGIIFLWVCRMIMFGLEFMGDVPFRDVYINQTVMDIKGRRMSKSLGTGVDPLEVIDKFGADALRFALVMRASQAQQDLRFEQRMVEEVRNFTTKIWNAARFVLMNVEGLDARAPAPERESLGLADRWIRSRHARLVDEATANLEAYEFDKAARAVYEFLWGEYCDWYLELAKVDLQHLRGTQDATRDARTAAVQQTLASVLSNAMQLLHPIMPFITEEVWQQLPHDGETIMRSPWPSQAQTWRDPEAEVEMEAVMSVIRAIRSIRAELALPPAQTVPVLIRADESRGEWFRRSERYISALARASRVVVDLKTTGRPARSVGAVLPDAEVFVELTGMADGAKERDRLQRTLSEVEADLERLTRHLEDTEFTSRAPGEVVEKERERAADLRSRRTRIQELLKALG
jgi:valyl-tRNA synthetase